MQESTTLADEASPEPGLAGRASGAPQERFDLMVTRLAAAHTRDEVATASLTEAAALLGLRNGAIWARDGGEMRALAFVGYSPDYQQRYGVLRVDAGLPSSDAILRKEAIFLGSREEYARAYEGGEAWTRPAGAPQVSMACLPLLASGEAVGVMVFAWPEARVFESSERRLLVRLAHHCSEALQRAELLERLRTSNETLAAVVRASPAAVMVLDLDGTVRMWNPAAERIFGWTADETVGRLLPCVAEEQRPQFQRHLEMVAAGRTLDGVEATRLRRSGPFDAAIWAAPLHHPHGHVQCVSLVMDITARKRAERIQRVVTEAGRTLGASMQLDRMLDEMATQLVPAFADYCFVDLVDSDGIDRVHVTCRESLRLGRLPDGVRRRYPLGLRLPWSIPSEPQELRARLASHITTAELAAAAADDGHRQSLLAAGFCASATAPLTVRGKVIGALTLAWNSRDADQQDLWLAEELARSVSLAIDSARLFSAEHRARVRMTHMQEVAGALSGASTVSEVAQAACRIGSEAMDAMSGAMWLVQPDGALALAGSWGTPEEYIQRFARIAPDDPDAPAVRVLRSGEAIWVQSAADYHRETARIHSLAESSGRLAAFGAVPLSIRGTVGGVIAFSHPLPHTYDADDRSFYLTLAHHCSQALDRAQLLDAERTSNERLRLLASAGEALSSSLHLGASMSALAQALAPAFCDWCAVDLVDGDRLIRAATAHPDPARARSVHERALANPIPLDGRGLLAQVVCEGKPVFLPRVPRECLERAAEEGSRDRAQLRQVLSSIVVPLSSGGEPSGVLSFTTTTASGRIYGDDDLRFALDVARRANALIDNARAFVREQRARSRLAALQQVTAALTRARTAEEVARVAVDTGAEVLEADSATVYAATDALRLLAQRGLSPRVEEELRSIPLDSNRVSVAVVQTAEPVFVHDLAAWESRFPGQTARAAAAIEGVRSYACLPLRPAGKLFGVLTYSFRQHHRFDPEERAFLLTLAENCAQSLERAQLLDSARAEAARAEQASRVKDEFLAMLGHELRNPLAPIFTAVELMKLREPGSSTRERNVIERQARHLARLVDDLLDVSRIASGRIRLDRVPVELADVVTRGLELARPLIEENRHALSADVPRGLVVDADPTRLSQVLSNLLTNAAKYTPPGGAIVVQASREKPASPATGGARSPQHTNASQVVLRIRDNGIGIAPDLLPRVFDLFSQGQQAMDRSRGGLGLGLAIVRSLVQLHGGTVEVHSEGEGKGSEFVLRLPALDGRFGVAAPASVSQRPSAALDSPRILVVDDNIDAAQLLGDALSMGGYTVRVANDGPSALAMAREFMPCAAVLDLGLPVMDGFELARRLRALPGLEDLRLVAATGYGQPSDRLRTIESGFDEHLVKPVELEQVEQTIRRLVERAS